LWTLKYSEGGASESLLDLDHSSIHQNRCPESGLSNDISYKETEVYPKDTQEGKKKPVQYSSDNQNTYKPEILRMMIVRRFSILIPLLKSIGRVSKMKRAKNISVTSWSNPMFLSLYDITE